MPGALARDLKRYIDPIHFYIRADIRFSAVKVVNEFSNYLSNVLPPDVFCSVRIPTEGQKLLLPRWRLLGFAI